MSEESERDLLNMNSLPAQRKRVAVVRRKAGVRRSSEAGESRVNRKSYRKLVTRLIGAAVVLIVAFPFVTYALRPHCEAWLIKRDLPRLKAELEHEKARKKDLMWEVARANTKEGAISQSRDYGYLKKGEVPFSVPGQTAVASPDKENLQEKPTLSDRFMLTLCRICNAAPVVPDAQMGK